MGYSLALALYHQYAHVFPMASVENDIDNLFGARLPQLSSEIQPALIDALGNVIHLKIKFNLCIQRLMAGDFSEQIRDQLQFIMGMQIPNIDILILMNTLPLLPFSKLTQTHGEVVHLLRIEVTRVLQGGRTPTAVFLTAEEALDDNSEVRFLKNLIATGALRGIIVASIPALNSLRTQRRAVSLAKQNDPEEYARVSQDYELSLRVLS